MHGQSLVWGCRRKLCQWCYGQAEGHLGRAGEEPRAERHISNPQGTASGDGGGHLGSQGWSTGQRGPQSWGPVLKLCSTLIVCWALSILLGIGGFVLRSAVVIPGDDRANTMRFAGTRSSIRWQNLHCSISQGREDRASALPWRPPARWWFTKTAIWGSGPGILWSAQRHF